MNSKPSRAKTVLLPGKTTHGHYQIEMACNECHTPFAGVKQNACVRCHQSDLEASNDTHPASKFKDPTNAARLELLDARRCITCHQEHAAEKTSEMGLTLPKDYCFRCHEDVSAQRPSHLNFTHDSCANAGCHNYHDNTALYENFLVQHSGEPDVFAEPHRLTKLQEPPSTKPLTHPEKNVPPSALDKIIVEDWVETAHSRSGVGCNACHVPKTENSSIQWTNNIGHETCRECHEFEVEGFLKGHHGMRLDLGLPSLRPSEARIPMKRSRQHESLSCNSCHPAHRFDRQYAAVEACVSCHNDQHTRNYKSSRHYELWLAEINGEAERGSGVSCAGCHLPAISHDNDTVRIQHNQNYNLRPNEKMIRTVCHQCHGLEFSLASLADQQLIDACFQGQPAARIPTVEMAVEWFKSKRKPRADNQ